ncbi:hypothetical protein NLJ89_g372 [Agrocybe chaxingu]|uniref:YCII-related domain-containing protein n=1 Tax=Agrocybe chaxingu TaxID=84603 RepID=A0A9W8TF08_9AGAR|nr:hypothetical protein NLJ89_g372 [Agrocybe chaxingu]
MSEATSTPKPKVFVVHAPDRKAEGTLARRLAVRPRHLEGVKPLIDAGTITVGGMLLDPDMPYIEGKSPKGVGSLMIVKAESLEAVRKIVTSDVYYTEGIWDQERVTIQPFFVATPFPNIKVRSTILNKSELRSAIPFCQNAFVMAQYIPRSSIHLNSLRFAATSSSLRCTRPALSRYTIRLMSSSQQYEHILVSRPEPSVVLVTLNRPKALNALCSPLFKELNQALKDADQDDGVGAMVLTGSAKAFAAGADIKEMRDKEFADVYKNNFLADWGDIRHLRKPLIAAVSGYALGGGCELALMCDIILAAPTAKFGQPEINLGVIPGGGGSQRLIHAIGKSRTMELVLTGRMFTAQEASDWGMVSRVVGDGEGEVVTEAVKMANEIASKSQVAVQAGKEVVNAGKCPVFSVICLRKANHDIKPMR